ncbi:MAG: hypothetical protein KAJ07_02210 [Planctomycetes bacterium]|nr:hypothetical protein [Planctomycetota bacterium]
MKKGIILIGSGVHSIGEATFAGSKSVTAQDIIIRSNPAIGAGAFVRELLQESGTSAGNPAKKIG